MKLKLILVPTDFSRSAEAALQYATMLARDLNAALLIVHVHATPELPGAYGDVLDPEEETKRQKLEALRPPEPFAARERLLVEGHPSDAIVRLAHKEHADLIVMGTHGQTNSPSDPMGAVASAVVRQAHCPVLTIHLPPPA